MTYIVGGWMHYASSVKELSEREVKGWEMKFIMDRYINSVTIEECVKQLPLEAPPEPVERRSVFREGSVPTERKQRQKRK